MTDSARARANSAVDIPETLQEVAQRTIELVYFAHIDQAAWADHVLAKHGIGRPHHRVLYFSNKFPGISVRELMALLRITNQALARTTTQLVTLGFLEQRYGKADRRVRGHFLSRQGEALLAKLTRHQVEQVAKSMAGLLPADVDGLWFGLETIIRPEDRRWLLPWPPGIPRARQVNELPADAAAATGGPTSQANGRGRPDRTTPPAAQKADITRRRR